MRTLLLFLILGTSLLSHAVVDNQEDSANLNSHRLSYYSSRYGISIGCGMNSVSASNVFQNLQFNQSAGIYSMWRFASISFETGLFWHRREYKLKGMIPEYNLSQIIKTNTNFLEIPLKCGWNFYISDFKTKDVYVVPNIGIYAAYGIHNDTDHFKRFDLGGKIGIDLYINRWKWGFSYTRGWVDIDRSIDRHLKTKSFDFTIGYSFYVK